MHMKNSIIFTATMAAILAMGVFVVPSVVFADSQHDNGHGQGDEHKNDNGNNSTDNGSGSGNSTDTSGGSNSTDVSGGSDSNSTNTSGSNSTTTVVFDDNNYRFNGALGFAANHPEIKSVSDIPQSFDLSKNDVQTHSQFAGNLFDVLHFLDLKGWKTSDLSDGQFVYLMEHFND